MHVHAGKTSLSDRLLAVNGLISNSSAGKVRFLDSRLDEQARQITIKASVVSLLYRRREGPGAAPREGGVPTSARQRAPKGGPQETRAASALKREAEEAPFNAEGPGAPPASRAQVEGPPPDQTSPSKSGGPPTGGEAAYVVNLIDCPGHVDFASEVSAAVRLCDGCLLLVDVVEGVCPQTTASLQQALKEGLVPLLVLTKADRLISILQLTPAEAYARCQAIIEQVGTPGGPHAHACIIYPVWGATRDAVIVRPRRGARGPPPSLSAGFEGPPRGFLLGLPAYACPLRFPVTGPFSLVNAHLHQQICSEFMAAGIEAWEQQASSPAGAPPGGAPRDASGGSPGGASSQGPLLGPLGDPLEEFVYFDEEAAKKLEFCPSKGNVLLASALHGWCLSIPSFASSTLLQQLGLPVAALPKLCRALWGDWYCRRRRSKRAPAPPAGESGRPLPQGGGPPPQPDFEVRSTPFTPGQPRMVEQLVLEPIWQLYAAAAAGGQQAGGPPPTDRVERLSKMAQALRLDEVDAVAAELRRLLSPERQRTGGDPELQAEELAGELVATIMRRWMPVGETLLEAIACRVPNPLTAARQRLRHLCPGLSPSAVAAASKEGAPVPASGGGPPGPPLPVASGGPPQDPGYEDPLLLLYISKFLAADTQKLRLTGDTLQGGEALGGFVGLCRIFTGRVRRGMQLFVCSEQASRGAPLSPFAASGGAPPPTGEAGRQGPPAGGPHLGAAPGNRQQYEVKEVYLLFGLDLRPVGEASAGAVVAVSLLPVGAPAGGARGGPPSAAAGGAPGDLLGDVAAWLQGLKAKAELLLPVGDGQQPWDALPAAAAAEMGEGQRQRGQALLQSLTLSNKPDCPPLVSSESKASSAIVRVAVEPQRLEDSQQFLEGMARLYLADPSIQLSVLDSGELLLGCCGEVHLETSLKDLETLFARVPIRVSPPMVAIRETLAFASEGEGGPQAPPLLSLSRRVAFPPWAPKGAGLLYEDESAGGPSGPPDTAAAAAGAPAAGAAAAGAAAAEDPLAAWIRRRRSSNSVVFGGGAESPLTVVLRAHRMPDAATEWLAENARELGALIKSRAPSPRFLTQQEALEAPPHPGESAREGASHRDNLLLRCLQGVEAQFCRAWQGTDKQEKEGPPSSSVSSLRGKGGGEGGPPGRLWGLALRGGACCALVASHTLTVLYPSGAPQCLLGGPPQETEEQEEGAPQGWASMAGAREAGLAAACNILGAAPPALSRLLPAVVSGFERGALNGPLAEEPIRGVVFELEALVLGEALVGSIRNEPQQQQPAAAAAAAEAAAAAAAPEAGSPQQSPSSMSAQVGFQAGQVSGGGVYVHLLSCTTNGLLLAACMQVISTVKEACRAAMLQRGRCRIYEAMLRFTLSCDSKVMGRAYGVLARRRAKIQKEEMPEGQTSLFLISGFLPTAEAVGISREIRSKASGHAALQLQFSHWEVLQEDPFPEACMTEEELEDEGEVALAALATQLTSRAIINSIRKTKGLPTEEKVVSAAEKQRTLSRNK
ncbi:hypothetical protein Efla_002996 [Eimeria flavescens]